MISIYPFYLIAFLSALFYAAQVPIAKKIGISAEFPMFTFMALNSAMSGTMSIIASSIFERGSRPTIEHMTSASIGLLLLYSLCGFIGTLCFWSGIKRINVVHYELICATSPFLVGVIAYFLLGEKFHPKYFVSIALTAIGIYIAVKQ